jgi:hypothetical protein
MKFYNKDSASSIRANFRKMEKNKTASKIQKGDCIETLVIILIGIICADILSDY